MSARIPEPFVITVGMTKGGTHKTWITLNFASYLGLMGYSVLVVDTNPQHDLAADYDWLVGQGIYPRFDVRVHDPIGVDGMPTKGLDLSRESGRDFIIYDTCQFLQLETTRFTWANCHVMLAPVTPNCAEIRNYQTADLTMSQVLHRLGKEGCEVPDFGIGNMIDDNPLMRAQLCRWIYSERLIDGRSKSTKEQFILKVNLSFRWVKYVIEKTYGDFPEPRLPVIFPDTHRLITAEDRKRMIARLKVEAAERVSVTRNGQ
jgi:CobQ/CobB/MinD/ParA nucleotide binding domain